MSKKKSFLLGAGIGLGLGLLFAPKSGKETREDLAKMISDLYEKAKQIDVEEVKNAIIVKTKELENTLKDLDKETAKQLIIDKSREVKIKAQELVDLAVEKGTPIVEKTAKKVKSKTAELLKNTAEKLEEPKKTKNTA
ncbi:MAG: YtxH domain-containing protein [Bacilli bacterium]|nr:YtxH domain-containing protein [Bacilli bacterium]